MLRDHLNSRRPISMRFGDLLGNRTSSTLAKEVQECAYVQQLIQERDDAIECSLKLNNQMCALEEAMWLIAGLMSSSLMCDEQPEFQEQFDVLDADWRLEQTPIPTLVNAMKTIKSNYKSLIEESDKLTVENRLLQESLKGMRASLHDFEQTNKTQSDYIKGLETENKDLKRKFKTVRKCISSIHAKEKEARVSSSLDSFANHEDIMRRCQAEENKKNSNLTVSKPQPKAFVTDTGVATIQLSKEDCNNVTEWQTPLDQDIVRKIIVPSDTIKIGLRFRRKVESSRNENAYIVCGAEGFDMSMNVESSSGDTAANLMNRNGKVNQRQIMFERMTNKTAEKISSCTPLSMFEYCSQGFDSNYGQSILAEKMQHKMRKFVASTA